MPDQLETEIQSLVLAVEKQREIKREKPHKCKRRHRLQKSRDDKPLKPRRNSCPRCGRRRYEVDVNVTEKPDYQYPQHRSGSKKNMSLRLRLLKRLGRKCAKRIYKMWKDKIRSNKGQHQKEGVQGVENENDVKHMNTG